MRRVLSRVMLSKFCLILLFVSSCLAPSARADQVIYEDSLSNGWENWGWATLNYNSTAYVHGGTKAISVSGTGSQAIYWHHAPFDSGEYTNLTFWLNGGASGGHLLQVQAQLNGTPQPAYSLPALSANTWQQFSIPLSTLGAASKSNLDGFWIQDRSGASFPAFYVDDVRLLSASTTNVPLTITITVDAARDRKPINPYIYGVAFASSNDLADLNVPLNRSGGNATTRYNWQQNSFQTAFDWFFQSLPYGSAIPGAKLDDFVSSTRAADAEPMITVPTMGWVADVTTNRVKRWSFSVAKYGTQTQTEYSYTGAVWASPDAGNGIAATTSKPITNNIPTDANMSVTPAFQRGWIEHLTNRWGGATNGGVRFYMLDNEPSLWHSTHRDVFRTGARMEEIRNRMIDYGNLVKSIDPGAVIFGPEEWGWSGYLYSGYDQQYSATNGYTVFPDRAAHGNQDYLPWILDQMRRTNEVTGKRLLDVFTLHYYPQGGEFSSNVTTDMQLRRNRSTRSLWDPNYSDESWISTSVQLIPRMKSWVQTNYPGTKIGITEYSWGADNHINGAIAQADVLGIFGREGLDCATRWTSPENGTPVYKAFKMFRNYDGQKSSFGEVRVFTQTPVPDELAAFAAVRTNDAALTLMVVNKSITGNQAVCVQLTNFIRTGTASVWQLNASNNIVHLPDATNVTTNFNYTFPAQTITLLIFQPRIPAPPQLNSGGMISSNQFWFSLVGEPGFTYMIQSSSDFSTWTPIRTNLLSTTNTNIVVPSTPAATFYRAVWKQ